MKRKILMISIIFTAFFSNVWAQDFTRKFDNVTKQELEMTSYNKAPEAEAVILYEDVDISYDVSG
ncbi:MAG: hypothetical protein LBT56_03135, partial [Prevotellaceae bacterium]|nr:hypothetical protein [Prevotellaceae bacterium]